MLTSKAADAVGHGSSKWGSREGWWGEGRTWGVAPVYRIWAPLGHPELTAGVLGELGLTRRRESGGACVVESGPRFHFHKGLGSQARCLCHFESCDSPSSPEPSALLFGGDLRSEI